MLRNKKFVQAMSVLALIAFLAVSILSVVPALTANAETAQEKIDNSVKKQSELKEEIEENKTKRSASIKEKELIDAEVNTLQSSIDGLNSDIEDANEKISEKESELEEAQAACDEQYEAYCERAKYLLENGSTSYLEILIHAESFSDFLKRISLVEQIAEYDNDRLSELKTYAKEVEDLKTELETERSGLQDLKDEADTQMVALEEKQSESQAIIDELTSDIKSLEAALAQQEAAESAAREEIRRLMQQASQQTQTSTTSQTTTQPSYSGGKFAWPCSVRSSSSGYGSRVHPITGKVRTHAGMDIGGPMGADIYAAEAGTVLVSGWNSGGYGYYVVINHGNGLSTLYAHCSSLLVSSGQSVSKGQVIAKVGSTGMSTGPHLHFEVHKNGSHTNPAPYLY